MKRKFVTAIAAAYGCLAALAGVRSVPTRAGGW